MVNSHPIEPLPSQNYSSEPLNSQATAVRLLRIMLSIALLPAIIFTLVVRGGNGVYAIAGHVRGAADVEPDGPRRITSQPFGDERPIRLGDHELQIGIRFHQRKNGFRIEVVRVIVTGGHHVDEIEARGIDDALGHADVRLGGVRVLRGQRIGKVGIEQEVMAAMFDQKSALAEPPQVHIVPV